MRIKVQDPVELDFQHYFVTGGTGSFGRTMVKHLLTLRTGDIIVFSRDEAKQDQMRQEINDKRVKYVLGDVRDYESVRAAMMGCLYVFHAAALKQVPACENWPMEAVKTNVLGADNVMRAAIENRVACCVLLSTDKAVYPVSAMGKSKAMMESLMLARAQHAGNTVLCATRYGNVMDSRGSVIPLFCKQIKAGDSITITDKRMTRFLMSLKDSVDLVMWAFENARPGDIFVQKVPSCRVIDLATCLRSLARKPQLDMIYTGIRPGEKLHESLVSSEEAARVKTFEPYWRISPDDYGSQASGDYNSDMAQHLGRWEMIDLLKALPCVQELMNAA